MNAINMLRALAESIDSLNRLEYNEKAHINMLKECIKGLGITLDDSVKEVYEHIFTDDGFGSKINKTLTFKRLFDAMNSNWDFHATIGVGDSIIRCRIFWLLTGIFNVAGNDMRYSDIYDLWLYSNRVRQARVWGVA